MSHSAAHATKFYEQVTIDQKVYGLEDDGSFLVFRIRDHDVVPFWSSRSRVTAIQKRNPKYRKWTVTEEPFPAFVEHTLSQLEAERISIGLNWSGERLIGYDIPVPELRKTLDYWTKKRSEANQSSTAQRP